MGDFTVGNRVGSLWLWAALVSALAVLGCGAEKTEPPLGTARAALTVADCPAGYNVIVGTPGNDTISRTSALPLRSTTGNDCILGMGGDDTIDGGGGNDVIIGGDGNDTLKGSGGNDKIYGEAGNDTITGGGGVDVMDGGDGDDAINGGAGKDTIYGGDGNDQLTGGGGNDVISGGAGDDVIDAGAGNDSVQAGDGNDQVSGGSGSDAIDGGNGNDVIDGGGGNDTVQGGDGDDLIESASGDTVNGGQGTDACTGTACELTMPKNCTSNAGCTAGAPFCLLTTGTCVACLSDSQCNDGNACTQTDVCAGGTCNHTNLVVCAASDQCHLAGACNPASGLCSNPVTPDGSSCSDGDACTQADTCLAGACAGGSPVVCVAADACHVSGACNPSTGICSNPIAPDGTSCSDADACTTGDACQAGSCQGSLADSDGDGALDCTDPCPQDPDDDVDDDGFCADVDNCPDFPNVDQRDTDADGRGDACNGPASTAIAAGLRHTCAIRDGGAVFCWGVSQHGQLGPNAAPNISPPVQVPGLTDAVAVVAGDNYSCALRAAGQVVCWGQNNYGQLGLGFVNSVPHAPTAIASLPDAVAITAGGSHTCALRANGEVLCWGKNQDGEVGIGVTPQPVPTPTLVSGLAPATAIGAGDAHTCALLATGDVYCWGNSSYGQIGDGSVGVSVPTPTRAFGLADAVAIAVGREHTCALRATGAVVCWGRNSEGEVGLGFASSSPVPTPTQASVTGVAAIAGGGLHTCALLGTGAVTCWGANSVGQLGRGTKAPFEVTPAPVVDVWDATALALGLEHTCALRATGEVLCWGTGNQGELGDAGATTSSALPLSVFAGPTPVVCPHPRSTADLPDAAFADSNGDGIDGDVTAAYFVSPAGSDSNPGTRAAPFRTIRRGIEASVTHPCRYQVLVAAGTYAETVLLASGVSLWGGYDPVTWARSPANTTTIASPTAVGLVVTEYASEGYVEGFTITSSAAQAPGESSRAVLLRNVTAPLYVRYDRLVGGNGATGLVGTVGGYEGVCGGGGGVVGAGAPGCGGAAGGAFGSPFGGWGGTGANATVQGSPGVVPANQSIGAFVGTNWSALAGGKGGRGGNGGGGGAGAPNVCFCSGGTVGGSGGWGGAGGGGGIGGGGGGGSFAVVAVAASSAIVTDNVLVTSAGGAGGPGGAGGSGLPGQSGLEGQICCGSFGAGAGGFGGRGGDGAPGGPGTGGGGGMSVGMLILGSSGIVTGANAYTIGAPGSAGAGGPGGPSGDPGLQANVFVMPP